MKPLKLELQAFGPYVEKQSVDFERLSDKGMFLIKGSTGSGKTTVFDAVSFALYGESTGEVYLRKSGSRSGQIGRNDIEDWRCIQAPRDLETFVSFTFESHGHRYIFKRRLVPKRVKMAAQYEAGEIDEDGNIIPFFNNPKQNDLNSKAEDLIGLTKDQFRQVVFLPQGQFERFLIAPSDEKETILKKIFGTEKWTQYADSFYEAAKIRKDILRAEKDEISSSLREAGVSSLEELDGKIAALEKERSEAEEAHRAFDSKKRQEDLNADIKLSEKFSVLHELEKKSCELASKKTETDSKKERYALAEKAESLRPLAADHDKAEKEYGRRAKAFEESRNALPAITEKLNAANKAKEEHEKNSPVERLQKKLGEYEVKRPFYEKYGELEAAFAEAEKKQKASGIEAEKAEKRKDAAALASKEAIYAFDEADKLAREYRDRYLEGIYGEIAAGLKDGEACPVCGSLSHPVPAEKSPGNVSKEEVDLRESERDRAKAAWDAAEDNKKKAEEAWNEKKSVLEQVGKDLAAAKSELDTAAGNLIDGIDDAGSLDRQIAGCRSEIGDYQKKAEDLDDELAQIQNEIAELNEKIKQAGIEKEDAGEKLASASELLEAALMEKGYEDIASAKADLRSDEERRRMHQEIVEYETQCRENERELAAKSKELSTLSEPDASRFGERQKEIRDEQESFSGKYSSLSARIDDLKLKKEILGRKSEHYNSEISEAEEDFSFAQTLRGDKSIGIQRYVLAVMFEQVIGYANEMLANVHGGRYRLRRTDERGSGSKRGLELKIHDNRSPEKEGRNVSTLSGGEKFLVSMALSIGMSTVAQKTGVQIEALFIDEGFGTLDESSIADAMNILESVRKNSGMIGIISHVRLLEGVIPTHLEVVKTENGSSIKLH